MNQLLELSLSSYHHCQLYSDKATEADIKSLQKDATTDNIFAERYLLWHSLVASSGSGSALKVLPSLIDVTPEARMNLANYYLKK